MLRRVTNLLFCVTLASQYQCGTAFLGGGIHSLQTNSKVNVPSTGVCLSRRAGLTARPFTMDLSSGTQTSGGMTRKEKQRMKKAEKAEKLKLKSEVRNLEDNLIDDLFDQVFQHFFM
jgi:hypothetical protein